MRINEITPSGVRALKNKKWNDEAGIYDFLANYGYSITGSGEVFGSSVLTSPKSSIAIKVTTDAAWIKFAKWTLKKSSSYLPKIRNIKNLNRFYVAFMEKLIELTPKNFKILNEYQYLFVDMIENPLENKEKINAIEQKYPNLMNILKDLYKAKGNFEWDLSAENFMERSNGTIVIVDPWANW